jgi:hypothetical protein
MALASVLFVAHRHPEALAAAHEALAWARRAGEPITLADSLNACAILEPRFEDGLRHGEEAGALFSTLGNHFRSATVWSNLGYVALARGENATAAALIAEARAEILKTVNDFGDAVVRTNEGLLALLRGVPEEAAALLAQVVVFAARAGTGAVLSEAVDALAAAAAARGQDETGARLHGAARALCAAPHHPDLESRLRASFFGPARARLGSVRWDAAFAAGARMDTQQIVECCRRLAARVSLDRPSRL